jgi:hypothetical protein
MAKTSDVEDLAAVETVLIMFVILALVGTLVTTLRALLKGSSWILPPIALVALVGCEAMRRRHTRLKELALAASSRDARTGEGDGGRPVAG